MDQNQIIAFRDFFLRTIKNEAEITKRVLLSLPEQKLDYRPDPKAKSALELAWHLAASEIWFLESIMRGEFSGSEVPMPSNGMNGKAIMEWYGAQLANILPRIEKLSVGELSRQVSFFSVATLPAVMFFQWSISHSIHHRGQLSTYLRPMGGKVPSIYGGSADQPMSI